jgi:hypothetical protein
MPSVRAGDRPGRVTCSRCCAGGPTSAETPHEERYNGDTEGFIVDREQALAREHGRKACELLGLETVRSGLLFPYNPIDEAVASWHHARIAYELARAQGLESPE